jgi:hypothetical protein
MSTLSNRHCSDRQWLSAGEALKCSPRGDIPPGLETKTWDETQESEIDFPRQNSDSLGGRN